MALAPSPSAAHAATVASSGVAVNYDRPWVPEGADAPAIDGVELKDPAALSTVGAAGQVAVATQDGRCMICNTDKPGTESGYWPVDDDHATGRVRALICSACDVVGLEHEVGQGARLWAARLIAGVRRGAPSARVLSSAEALRN